VHYLFRDPATAPAEVHLQAAAALHPALRAGADARLSPARAGAVLGARRARLQARARAAQRGVVQRLSRLRRAARRADHVPPEAGAGFSTGYSYVAPVVRLAARGCSAAAAC
jgi:hypothetical protein